VAVALVPAAASAAAGSGAVTLTVGGKGKAAKALTARGVEIAAIAPAKKRGKRVALPVRDVAVGKAATVELRGGLRLETGKRVLKLRALRVRLAPRRATVSAKVGKGRVAVFAAKLPKGKAKLDRSKTTAKLAGAKLALTPRGARLLRAKLALPGIPAALLGRFTLNAAPRAGSGGGAGGGGTGNGEAPKSDGGVPKSGPIKSEPPVLARPSTAVGVSAISIAWYPRDSWIRYLTSGTDPQDGIFASGGATKAPPMETPDHPCSDAPYSGDGSFDYAFGYAPKSGWYDPPTQTAAIYGQGSVRFRWQSHTIDLIASDPEIELNPTNPRTIFRFNGSGGTAYPDQRASLTNLDLTGQPTVVGNTRTYTTVPGRLTEDGQSVFAGFYPPPNDGFGCITVTFTTAP
jgi:hypothetical protein